MRSRAWVGAAAAAAVSVGATVGCSSEPANGEAFESTHEALIAATLGDFDPPDSTTTTVIDVSNDRYRAKPVTTWDCNPHWSTIAGPTSFTSCTSSATQLDQPTINNQFSGSQVRARAYLREILGGTPVTVDEMDGYWTDSARLTARRVCWLREAVRLRAVRVKYWQTSSICGRGAAIYHLEGSLAGIDFTAACGANPTNKNPAAHIAVINRTVRAAAGWCPQADRYPTFFQVSRYVADGDTQALIDPEPASLNGSFAGTAATAAATAVTSKSPLTTYRYGTAYPKRVDGTTDRTKWVGQPCVVGTASYAAGTVINKIWMPLSTNNTYLQCNECGARGQACCPNPTSVTTLDTCDKPDASGTPVCDAATKTCK